MRLSRRALALVLAASSALVAMPAGAQEQQAPVEAPQETPATTPPTPAAPPAIPALEVDEVGRRAAQRRLAEAKAALVRASRHERAALRSVEDAGTRFGETEAAVVAAAAADREAAARYEAAKAELRRHAVAAYVIGPTAKLEFALESTGIDDVSSRRVFLDSVERRDRRVVDEHRSSRSAASDAVLAALIAREEAGTVLAAARDAAATATAARADAELAVAQAAALLDVVTAAAPAPATDVPRLALDAYRRAADAMTAANPACRMRWPLLAAVGRVESNHGRIRNGILHLNGDVSPRIVGIPLDGTNATRAISDTDGGLLDGDVFVDRAVGPMQFIPSTWRWAGRDGNGDGTADPNNLYDAALSAAAYLCRAAGGLGVDTEEGFRRAVWSYNHSDAYVARVRALAVGYDAVVLTPAASLQPPPTARAARRGSGS